MVLWHSEQAAAGRAVCSARAPQPPQAAAQHAGLPDAPGIIAGCHTAPTRQPAEAGARPRAAGQQLVPAPIASACSPLPVVWAPAPELAPTIVGGAGQSAEAAAAALQRMAPATQGGSDEASVHPTICTPAAAPADETLVL